MTTVVLLWGSAAIFTSLGARSRKCFAVLILCYALALRALFLIGLPGRIGGPGREQSGKLLALEC